MFSPHKHYDETKRGNFKNLERPGTYLVIAARVVEHGTTPKGNRFTKFGFDVISGPEKGASFVDSIFRNENSYGRLAALMYSMRNHNTWDPSDDDDAERNMLGRAFKCSVKIEIYDGKRFARIKFPEANLSDAEVELCEQAEAEWKFKRESESSNAADFNDDDPGMDDDDFDATPNRGRSGGGGSRRDDDGFDDFDDVPF